MDTKNKIMGLLKEGFKLTTLKKLDEKQINVLYKKVVNEQGTAKKVIDAAAASEMLANNLEKASEMLETDELNEWGSSDQNIMNASIHRDMGEPETMPSPFDDRLESAAQEAVDFYWDDWEEYESDYHGLVDDAKRRYLRSYFPEYYSAMVRMFEPVRDVDPYDVDIDLDGELGESQISNDLDKMAGVDPNEDPNPEGNEDGPSNYGVNPKKDKSMNDGMGIDESKKKPSKMKTPITTLGMFEDEIKEKFRSKAQQGYFFAKCEEEGSKSKWCEWAREFADDTKDFSKLPDKVETNEGTKCWKGYEKKGMKTMFGKRVPNCVKKESKEEKVRQIEETIVSLIKNYKKPTMTKKDLLEMSPGTKEAPVKTPTRTKPDRKSPYKPKHKPAPKASAEVEIPSFLKFDNLNITFRDE